MSLDFGSRERLRQELVQLAADESCGAAYLLVGGPRSGKSTMLEELAATCDPRVRQQVSLGATGGVVSLHAITGIDRAAELGLTAGRVVGVVGKLASVLGAPIVGRPTAMAGSAMRFSSSATLRLREHARRSSFLPQQVLQALRTFDKPLLILVDDIDEVDLPDWWWSQLLFPLLNDIRNGAAHLLVASGGPEHLPPAMMERAMGAGLNVEELRPLVEGDVKILTGPATDEVARVVIASSGGHVGSVVAVWREMTRARCVLQDGDTWRLVADHPHVADLLMASIQRQLAELPLQLSIANAFAILRVASYCGSVFTAEAIAKFLNLDRDGVLDVLDDIQGVTSGNPIVKELDSVVIPGDQTLWRYELSAHLRDAMSAINRTHEPHDESLSGLADSMLDVYGPMRWIVAADAVRLYWLAGEDSKAMAAAPWANEVEGTVLRAHLDILLRQRSPSGRDAEHDFELAHVTLNRIEEALSRDELVAYATDLLAFAETIPRSSCKHAASIGLASAFCMRGGPTPPEMARGKALTEDVLSAPSASPDDRLSACFVQAQILMADHDLDGALPAFERAEELGRGAGHDGAAAQALVMQASICDQLGRGDATVATLLDQYESVAPAQDRGWASAVHLRIALAARSGRQDDFRSYCSQIEALLLRRYNYSAAAQEFVEIARVEADWLRDGRSTGGEIHVRDAINAALSHAARTKNPRFLSEITQQCDEIMAL